MPQCVSLVILTLRSMLARAALRPRSSVIDLDPVQYRMAARTEWMRSPILAGFS